MQWTVKRWVAQLSQASKLRSSWCGFESYTICIGYCSDANSLKASGSWVNKNVKSIKNTYIRSYYIKNELLMSANNITARTKYCLVYDR